jgi:hypothetical protein
MISIRQYSPADAPLWNEFIAKSKNGTFLFDRRYMDYHSDRFADSSLIAADDNGTWLSVMPANRVGNTVLSHGGLTYGGFISDETMTTTKMVDLFAALCRYLSDARIERLEYKTMPAIYHRLPADEDRFALFSHGAAISRRDVLSVIDLSAPGPVQARRKRGAAKAESAGLTIEESEEWPAFWQILAANLLERHDRRPVHALEEITLLHRGFPASIKLFIAKRDGEVMGGAVLYIADQTVHVQYIASSIEGRKCGALDLLFVVLIERHRSFRYFDFGISNESDSRVLNRGLTEFKEGFGARAIVHDHYALPIPAAA